MIATITEPVGTGSADLITAPGQKDAQVVDRRAAHFIHMTDKVLIIPLTLIKQHTQHVMRAQLQLTHRLTTLDRRFDRSTAKAIFAASKRRNGTTQSMRDSTSPMPVTTMNQIVPVT